MNDYSSMAQSCVAAGTPPSASAGSCDADSWRRCCEQCVGDSAV